MHNILKSLSRTAILFIILILTSVVIAGCHNNDSSRPQSSIERSVPWHLVSHFNRARRGLAAFATSGHLYVIGGVDKNGNYVSDVEFAKIYADGTLGQWRSTTSLTQGRIYASAITQKGYVYVIGGGIGKLGNDNQPVATVEKARVLDNGHLGQWQPEKPLDTPRRGLQVAQFKNYIYAIGGYNGSFLKSVERAILNAKGEIKEWITENETSQIERYIHSATIYKGYIYLLGGHMHNQDAMSYGDVEAAKLATDGRIGEWKIERSSLNTPRFIAQATAIDNKLYMIGGHNGSNRLDSVEVASLSSSGNVGQWKYSDPLSTARSAAAIVKYGKFIYMLGGMDRQRILNSVEVLGL